MTEAVRPELSHRDTPHLIKYSLLVFLLLLTVSGLLFRQQIKAYFVARITSEALARKIFLDLNEPQIYFPGLRANEASLQALISPFLFKAKVQDLDLRLRLPSLPLIGLVYDFAFKIFNGIGHGSIRFVSEKNRLDTSFSIERLNLALIPESLLPVDSGFAHLQAKELRIIDGNPVEGEIKIKLSELSKSHETSLTGDQIWLPFISRIPSFNSLWVQANIKFNPQTIEIKDLHVFSELGKVKANIISDYKGQIIYYYCSVQLSEQGLVLAGPHLSKISQGRLKKTSRNFVFKYKGIIGRKPTYQFAETIESPLSSSPSRQQ